MHLPRLRPRIRLRTLLIAVAVIGLTIGGWQTWRRREFCLERARSLDVATRNLSSVTRTFEGYVRHLRRVVQGLEMPGEGDRPCPEEALAECEETLKDYRALTLRVGARAARYRRVARHPWLPLPRESE